MEYLKNRDRIQITISSDLEPWFSLAAGS
jgi:hypothetical protein